MTNPALAEILASYVPKLIQKRIAANPAPIDSPRAEEIQAAVLFADISGFTRLTERLAEAGPAGAEMIANILNEYFGQLIDIIHNYDGDVVKFAGDAVIAVWWVASSEGTPDSTPQTDPRQWTMRATECAVEIRERLSNYKVDNESLYLKIAVSAGSITTAHVGGVFNRWEFLLTGNPLVEAGIANGIAKAGEILLTPSAWRMVRNICEGEPVEFELKDAIAQGGRLKGLKERASIKSQTQKTIIADEAENSLRPYIPGAIINRLTAGQSSWIAELRRATILFINLPDINQKTELADAQEITRLIQRSVYRYEGSINKINVDDKGITIVAAMGLPPFSHEDDPSRGLQAALMIRDELSNIKTRSNIGVTTGRIFCGSIGNDSRREYTTIGNAVNLSARLMTAAGMHTEIMQKFDIPILCDRSTMDAAKDEVEFETLPPQQLKGRSEAVEVFHPISLKKSVIRPVTEMIGRQEEKSIIANALQELSRGEAHQTLIVQGEAGIGKSRLFEDLVRQAETLKVKMFLSASDPIERSNPYHVWRPIFYKIFDIEELASKVSMMEVARNTIQNKVLAKLNEIDPDLTRYYPLLDVVLPIQIPNNDLTSAMSGEIRSSNIREILTRLLIHEAHPSPLLIVLEDMHWFDTASWNLLVDVQQKVRPILLALNTRPLPDPVIPQFKQIQETEGTRLVKLEAMMLNEVEALVCQHLGVKSVPTQVGRLIREKSEGHPFFAEELAYALRDSGVLIIQDQECRVRPNLLNLEGISLPDSLQAAIINRIDSLNPAQQLTLKVASVIGRIFAFQMLEAIHPIDADKPQLPGYMDALTHLSLTMIESDAPDLAYTFKHAVTQEVAYNLMLFSQRRKLHQAVAEWIEHTHTNNLDTYYSLLAHHWTQAAEAQDSTGNLSPVRKALEYLEKAGEQAMENHASRETVQFFSQALEMDTRLPKSENRAATRQHNIIRARWHGNIGLAHYALGSLPDCERHIREALHLLESSVPRSTIEFALGLLPQMIRQAFHRYLPARFVVSLKGYDREAALETARLYEVISRVYFYSNEALPITYSILRCLNEAEKGGTSPELATAYGSMAVLAGFTQLHKLAESYVQRAVSVAEKVNKLSCTITTNVVTSVYQITVGKWNDVRDKATEAKSICERLGDYRQWGDAVALISESAFISGDIKKSTEVFSTMLEEARRRRNPLQQLWSLFGLGINSIRRGEDAQAILKLKEALQLIENQPNLASEINANGQIALAYFRTGDTEKALAHAERVLELALNLRPTVYSLHIGFSAVAHIYFELWEAALANQDPKEQVSKLRQHAEQATKILRMFKSVFPIGGPYYSYYQGWREWLMGRRQIAVLHWQNGLISARKYHLLYEEGLLRARLGVSLPENPSERKKHLEHALQIFEKMEAAHEIKTTKQALIYDA